MIVLLMYIACMMAVAHKVRMATLRNIRKARAALHNEQAETALEVLEDMELVYKM
jgi:hypothetical protein